MKFNYSKKAVSVRFKNKTCSLTATVTTVILALPGRISPTGNLFANAL